MAYSEIKDPFRRLVRIMQRLQEPGGCPWDLQQTHDSLKPYVIEEAYEVIDAIESGAPENLKEELGDLLLQVIFHSVLSARLGNFAIDDVVETAAAKMVFRHPHVFGETEAHTAEEVLRNWEKLKQHERKRKKAAARGENENADANGGSHVSHLSGVPRHLPALLRAQRIQEKAARVGFDHPNVHETVSKLREEIEELGQAAEGGNHDHVREEFGDVLFSLVNLARSLKFDAEDSLRQVCDKFTRRFEHIERAAHQGNRSLSEMSVDEMEEHWQEAKRIEKDGSSGA